MKKFYFAIVLLTLCSCSHVASGYFSRSIGDKVINIYEDKNHKYHEFFNPNDTLFMEVFNLPSDTKLIRSKSGVFKGITVTFNSYELDNGSVATFAVTEFEQFSRRSSPIWQDLGY